MWQNLNPVYGPAKNTFKTRLRTLLKKIWRRAKIYLEHDEYRMINQLTRYNSNVIKIGDFTYGHPDTNSPRIVYFGEKTRLTIGKFCCIAEHVTIFMGGYHNSDFVSVYPISVAYSDMEPINVMVDKKETIIGNDVWIGAHAIIMGGITIGDGAIIASGSVVAKDVGNYEIVGGNPAKLIRKRFSEKQIESLMQIKWWEWDIEKIKNNVKMLNGENVDTFIETFRTSII